MQTLVGIYFNGGGGQAVMIMEWANNEQAPAIGPAGAMGASIGTKANNDNGAETLFLTGDRIGFAINLDNGYVWMNLNGEYLAAPTWFTAGNDSPVPGQTGWIGVLDPSQPWYFCAPYNGARTFGLNAINQNNPANITKLTLALTKISLALNQVMLWYRMVVTHQ